MTSGGFIARISQRVDRPRRHDARKIDVVTVAAGTFGLEAGKGANPLRPAGAPQEPSPRSRKPRLIQECP